MSDSESEDYATDENESQDEEEIISFNNNVISTQEINLEKNPIYMMLLEQSKFPTAYLAHKILMSRILSVTKGAALLIDDPVLKDGSLQKMNYSQISDHIYDMCIKEIEKGVCPIEVESKMFKGKFFPVSHYDKEHLLGILRESRDLAREEI